MESIGYSTDLSDKQWVTIELYFPEHSGRGRKRKWELRLVVNAIIYVKGAGCAPGKLARNRE